MSNASSSILIVTVSGLIVSLIVAVWGAYHDIDPDE
jgi:hypothetical protein